jgi:glucose dehydrogenase
VSPRIGTLALVALLLAGCLREPQRDLRARGDAGSPGEWPSYGHDAGGTRYSPLTAIDRANVHHSQPLRNA